MLKAFRSLQPQCTAEGAWLWAIFVFESNHLQSPVTSVISYVTTILSISEINAQKDDRNEGNTLDAAAICSALNTTECHVDFINPF